MSDGHGNPSKAANKGSTSQEGNLDITQVPNEDLDGLASKIENFYKMDSTVKTRLSYNWDRNHKFLDGNQWIVFDGDRDTGGLWKRLTVSKANEYIPRPVTNYIFDAFQTLKSYLIKNKPRSSVRPNTNLWKDKAAAKVADLILEYNWERLCEERNYEYGAACALTYGTVFKKDFADMTAPMLAKIPEMQQIPKTDPMTGAVIGMEEVPVLDPITQQPVFQEVPIGDVNTEIVEPYRIALDPACTDMHKAKWIMEYAIQPLDWIKDTYGKQEEGYTGLADTVTEETTLSGSMRRFNQLKNSSGTRGGQNIAEGSTGNSGDVRITNSAVVKEYYERPTIRFPKGRLVVVANGVTLYAGTSPCEGPELDDWHPYSEFRWEIVPGRFWGKSPMDVGVEIQKQINSIDAVIVLTRKTMAIPQKLIPATSGIAPGEWTGRPGQEIRYRDSGGQPPSIIPAAGVDISVFKEREQRVEDLKNVMGAIDILKGDRPPGVTAASALNLLYEVGTGKLYPALDRWKRFVQNSQKKQLRVVSKLYKEPRPEFIAALKQRNNELSDEEINKFIGADLYDNCNVIIEAESNVPKLHAAKQASLQEAAQAGTLALDQPSNRNEYNRQMGIVGFDNDVGPDIKRANWENDLLDNIELSPDNKPVVLIVDNHPIHKEILANRMKEPSFMKCSQAVQQAYMQHYQEHEQFEQQAAQQAAMEAMIPGAPPAQPPAGNAPQPLHSVGAGPTAAVKAAVKTDALQMPGGGPRG